MTNKRPKAVDLFAGVGGLSLGLEQAGFEIAAAVEIDPIHAAAHKFNFPKCEVLPRSVIGLAGREIRGAAGIEGEKVDLVAGGPPCQGFSLIGQRALDDPRNSLVKEFVRIVADLDASYFVFENVKGLTLGSHGRFLLEVISAFEELDYQVKMPWRVLNAAHFGVPQDRERLFLIGAKRGLAVPDYPEPLTRPAGSSPGGALFGLPEGPSCYDALGDLPEAEDYEVLIETDCVGTDAWGEPSAYAKPLRCLSTEDWFFGHRRKSDPGLLTASMRTSHSAISRRRFAETTPGCVEPISRFFRLPRHGVSNTLRAGTDAARGAFTSPRPIHYDKARCVTVREMARLHGFPDWFRFHETKWHGARQVGNSVAPPLARAIGLQIATAMGLAASMPTHTLALGNASLLRLEMAQAASFWGIPVPIGGRDRKSGAKKRKQEEIEALRVEAF